MSHAIDIQVSRLFPDESNKLKSNILLKAKSRLKYRKAADLFQYLPLDSADRTTSLCSSHSIAVSAQKSLWGEKIVQHYLKSVKVYYFPVLHDAWLQYFAVRLFDFAFFQCIIENILSIFSNNFSCTQIRKFWKFMDLAYSKNQI